MLKLYCHELGKKRDGPSEATINKYNSNSCEKIFSQHLGMEVTKQSKVSGMDVEIIVKFDPDKKHMKIKKWLNTIDRIAQVYSWDEDDCIVVMKARLRGAAREWLDELKHEPTTWDEWKECLIDAFLRPYDYVDRLQEMLARNKDDGEKMSKYFDDKMRLIKRCALKGKAALSCMIRGLPVELQTNAEALDFESPDELYNNYLWTFENYKEKSDQKLTWQQTSRKTCFYCNKTGHDTTECRFNRCTLCRRFGHDTKDCWYGPGAGATGGSQASRYNSSNPGSSRYNFRLSLCYDILFQTNYLVAKT